MTKNGMSIPNMNSYEGMEIDKSNRVITKNKEFGKEEYKFNKLGQLILKTEYSNTVNIKKELEYKYDKSGNLISESGYKKISSQHAVSIGKEYKYDLNGNKMEEKINFEDPCVSDFYQYRKSYKYDKNNNLTQKICYEYDVPNTELKNPKQNQKMINKTTYFYKDDKIEKEIFEDYLSGKKYEDYYFYDEKGNWTSKKSEGYSYQRVIKYYE